MYSLFPELDPEFDTISRGSIVVPQLRYAYKKLNAMIKKAVLYRRYSGRTIPNQHPLVRFISALSTSNGQEVDFYVDNVLARADRVIRTAKFTTMANQGDVHHLLYGENIVEAVLIKQTRPDDLMGLVDNWFDLAPIRVIDHPFTDLSFDALNGDRDNITVGMATIEIDIVSLMVQYRQWQRHIKQMLGEDATVAIGQFLYQYPLANALRSHIDIACRNRLFYHCKNLIPSLLNDTRDIPEFIGDYTGLIDEGYKQLATRLMRKRISWDELLQGIILPSDKSIYDTLALPKLPYVQQITWLYAMSRMTSLQFLMWYDHVLASRQNRDQTNNLRREIKRLLQMGIYRRIDAVLNMLVEDAVVNDILKYAA